jgi:hypothetical protein
MPWQRPAKFAHRSVNIPLGCKTLEVDLDARSKKARTSTDGRALICLE